MIRKISYGIVTLLAALGSVSPVYALSQSDRPIVYTNGLDGHVVSIQPDGNGRKDYGSGYFPKLSPDGRKLAFIRDNADFSARDLYVVNTNGTQLRKIADRVYTQGSASFFFSWSPDGTRLVYTSESGSSDPQSGSMYKQIAVVGINGAGSRQLTRDEPGVANGNPVWSPDGKSILYQRNADLYIMNAGGHNKRLVVAGATSGSWSPDARRIVFVEADLGVRTANSDGSGRVTLSPIGSSPRWSPDGTKIVMEAPACGCQADPASIVVINPDGSNKFILASPPTVGTVQQPVWSPDSRSVAFVEFARWQPARLVIVSYDGTASVVTIESVGYPEWAYLSKVPAGGVGAVRWNIDIKGYLRLEATWR